MKGMLLVCAAVAAIPRGARADADAAAIDKVVAAQVAAIGSGTAADFATTLAPDVFAMVPGGYAAGGEDVHRIGAKRTKVVIGRQGAIAWVTADVAVTAHVLEQGDVTTAYVLTELLAQDHGAWKARALFLAQPMKDRPRDWAQQIIDENVPGDEAPATAPLAAWLTKTTDLAAHLHAGADVIVLGSEAGDRGAGAAGVKLLGQWKKIVFTADWTRAGGDGATFAWAAARVDRTVTVSRDIGDVIEPYWVLVLAVKGAKDWEIVSVHYAQDRPRPPAP